MQMAQIFAVNTQAISKHTQNIYKDNELDKQSASSKMELFQMESGRNVKRNVDYYNLEIIISEETELTQWKVKNFVNGLLKLLNNI